MDDIENRFTKLSLPEGKSMTFSDDSRESIATIFHIPEKRKEEISAMMTMIVEWPYQY